MRARLGVPVCVQLAFALTCGAVWAGANEQAAAVLTPTEALGDTLAYTVTVTGMMETGVVHLEFSYDRSLLSFVGWQGADFPSSPLQIGPRVDDPPGTVLIALAWRELQEQSPFEVGTIRFFRPAQSQAAPVMHKVGLVDRNYRMDWIVTPDSGGQMPSAPRGDQVVPARFHLADVTPNPMIRHTTISFEIPRPGAHVRIKIYDVTGRVTRTLVDERRAPAYYTEVWDLANDQGRVAAPGIYFCTMEAETFKDTKKLVLLR